MAGACTFKCVSIFLITAVSSSVVLGTQYIINSKVYNARVLGSKHLTRMVKIMARLARVVVPGYPHHITQRGNRRQKVFFRESDYSCYLDLLREWCGHENIEIWAYCLMTNHYLCGAPHK